MIGAALTRLISWSDVVAESEAEYDRNDYKYEYRDAEYEHEEPIG